MVEIIHTTKEGDESLGYDVIEGEWAKSQTGHDGPPNMSRRSALGVIAAGVAAVTGLGSSGKAEARDYDSREYVEEAKRIIMGWYNRNRERIHGIAIGMQQQRDRDGGTPATKVEELPREGLPRIFSRARMEVKFLRNFEYEVRFFVTEPNGDVDCGWRNLTLTPRR